MSAIYNIFRERGGKRSGYPSIHPLDALYNFFPKSFRNPPFLLGRVACKSYRHIGFPSSPFLASWSVTLLCRLANVLLAKLPTPVGTVGPLLNPRRLPLRLPALRFDIVEVVVRAGETRLESLTLLWGVLCVVVVKCFGLLRMVEVFDLDVDVSDRGGDGGAFAAVGASWPISASSSILESCSSLDMVIVILGMVPV